MLFILNMYTEETNKLECIFWHCKDIYYKSKFPADHLPASGIRGFVIPEEDIIIHLNWNLKLRKEVIY